MKNRETFNFYRSFYEAGKSMAGNERLSFYDAILLSSFEEETPVLEGLANIVFTAIKPVIDNQTANYLNGKKGGRPPKNNPPLSKKNNPPSEKKKSYKEKEKDKDKDITKALSNYDYFISILKDKSPIKSKVTKTKDGREVFKKIENKSKLIEDYIQYQIEKKEFAIRITPFMEDYNTSTKIPIQKDATHNRKIGGYSF